MRYRVHLAWWGVLSPITWIILMIVVSGHHITSLPTTLAVGAFTIISFIASYFAYMVWCNSEHFFKSIDRLESEIERYNAAKKMYTRKLEELVEKEIAKNTPVK